jgi:hypothetical protein
MILLYGAETITTGWQKGVRMLSLDSYPSYKVALRASKDPKGNRWRKWKAVVTPRWVDTALCSAATA